MQPRDFGRLTNMIHPSATDTSLNSEETTDATPQPTQLSGETFPPQVVVGPRGMPCVEEWDSRTGYYRLSGECDFQTRLKRAMEKQCLSIEDLFFLCNPEAAEGGSERISKRQLERLHCGETQEPRGHTRLILRDVLNDPSL